MSWNEEMHKHMLEENNGYDEYMRLAEMAEADGHHDKAGVLRDIAHEEKTHHELLYEMME